MNKLSNIKYVVKNGLCIGCGVCEAACPNSAIKMIYNDKRGIFLSMLDDEKCNGCGTCLNICYGYKVDHEFNLKIFHTLPSSIIGNFNGCYLGFAKNKTLRFNSTSGGVATALLLYALQEGLIEGAVVTKMEAGKPPRAKAFIASTAQEIISAEGSKYCPVSLAEALRAIKNGKRYAIVGLPCHIYAIRKLAQFSTKIRKSVRLYLGILCGGMPSYLGTLYLLRRYKMDEQYITRLEYRGGGWPGRLLIQSKTSDRFEEVSVPYPEYWHGAFQFFFPYRCIFCHDGFNEFSDVSCGDAWLPKLINNNSEGVSLIITRTEMGEHLVHDAHRKGYLQIAPIEVQDIIESQPGLIQFKNVTLKARINLCKTFRKKLPTFDLSRTPIANFRRYLSAVELCAGNLIASKKNLWWLLDIYVSLHLLKGVIVSALFKRKTYQKPT